LQNLCITREASSVACYALTSFGGFRDVHYNNNLEWLLNTVQTKGGLFENSTVQRSASLVMREQAIESVQHQFALADGVPSKSAESTAS